MDAKRRRLSPGDSPKACQSSGLSKAGCSPESKGMVTLEQLKSGDRKVQEQALKTLKQQIRTKAKVQEFVENKNKNGRFLAVIDILSKATAELDQDSSSSAAVPQEHLSIHASLSILANCCYHSTTACLEMKQTHLRFNYMAVKLFESSKLSDDCKYSLTRLVANMCAHKEAALSVSNCSSLMDLMAKQLESEHSVTVGQALRCTKLLVSSTFTRATLLSNAGFYLGRLISKRSGKQLHDAIDLLQAMSQRYVMDVGRQLAGSDCAEKLLSLFLSGEEPAVKGLVIRLSGASSDIRDIFGEKDAILRIIDQNDLENPDRSACAFLATFSHEAWGRATLRTSGALDILVKRLAMSDSDNERMSILKELKHFIHDTAGMAHLAKTRLFVDTVVKDVQLYLKNDGSPCKPKLQTNEDIFRPDSPLLMEIESNLRRGNAEQEREERLYKDFFSCWSYASPSPARSHGSSQSFSPPSSGAGSPVYASPTSPGTSCGSKRKRVASFSDDWEDDSGSGMSERGHVCRTIVDSELWLVCWQAQEDGNLPHLIREDLVEVIISYLSRAPKADFRMGRALKRMASFRVSIDRLLQMQFHTRVLSSLCGSACRLTRNAKRCARCEKCADFGREVLREFSSHVDSDFGYAFLKQEFAKEDFLDRTKAAIAKVSLIKNRGKIIRCLSISHQASVDILFESLQKLLEKEDFEAIARDSTYSGGLPLVAQITGALSVLIPQNKIRDIFDVEATFVPSEHVRCKVSTEEAGGDNSEEMISFEENGKKLATIPLEAATKNSGYFAGLFANDWKETEAGQRTFSFDAVAQNCSSADFTRFLHYLAGCRDECTRVDNAVSLLALIQLSDRHLCASLGDWLCSPHGPMSRLLSGDSLHFLLPAALTASMHPRFLSSCFATLMRYSNGEDVVSALLSLHSSDMLVQSFISQLRVFVTGLT